MSINNLDRENFDERLRQALQAYSVPTDSDFTRKISSRIRKAQEQKILARVIIQERLALGVCIGLFIITIAAAVILSTFTSDLANQLIAVIYKISQTIETINYEWLLYIVFPAVLGFVVYSFMDLLAGNR